MSGFLSAKETGKRSVSHIMYWSNKKGYYQVYPQDDQHEPIENLIFLAMEQNPYKSEQKRREFIEGVSEAVNRIARMETRKMNNEHE